MGIAALIAWLLTAAGGFYLLATWLSRGGARQQEGNSRFPVPVILGHFLLAAAGLVVWIVYLVAASAALAWTAFVILLPVALLGFVMLARWIPVYRSRAVAVSSGPGTPASAEPAEQRFPLPVVFGHGLLAVVTLVLVLITAISA